MKNPMIKNTIILTLITLISGLLLGTVYGITKDPIARRNEETTLAAYRAVLPDAESFEEMALPSNTQTAGNTDVTAVIKGLDSSGATAGYVINVTDHESYGGDVTLAVGVLADNSVCAIEILEINDTPGLGMKAKDDEFKMGFEGFSLDEGDQDDALSAMADVDAISGATITTNAVKRAVFAALKTVSNVE